MRKILAFFVVISFGIFNSASAMRRDPGMWMPKQVPNKEARLRELGTEMDIQGISDPTKFPLNSIIQLGNPTHLCSASFVSKDGLVITNHHCIEGFLSTNSATLGRDILNPGFLARTQEEEIPAAETARLYITKSFRDVTAAVLGDVANIADPAERYKAVQANMAAAKKTCQDAHSTDGIECEISSFFEGAQFYEIQKFVIRDVRLVYAPDQQIGFYGGWADNWRWPRHAGDYGFLRGYVAPNGASRGYDKENVPFRPEHHLKVAQNLSDRDVVFVLGYPGRTYSLSTAAEAKEAAEWSYPWVAEHYKALVEVLHKATEGRTEARFLINPTIFSLTNTMQNREGSYPNMISSQLISEKFQIEAEMSRWLRQTDRDGAKYKNVLTRMEKLFAEKIKTRAKDLAFNEMTSSRFSSALIGAAEGFLQYAEAPAGEVIEKREAYKKNLEAMYKDLDTQVDDAKLKFQLERMANLPADDQPESYKRLVRIAEASGRNVVEYLTTGSLFSNKNALLMVLDVVPAAHLRSDPMIQFAEGVAKERKDVMARASKFSGEMTVLRPLYVAAVRDYTKSDMFPDANSTLRVSFGTVMGYSVPETGVNYTPFSRVSDMIVRAQPEGEFVIPMSVMQAVAQDGLDGLSTPVNFLSDCHITGGNSGSATVNGRGEIVGLAFDSNYEGLGSDWKFIPQSTRTIHVDIRYVLWLMKNVHHADNLLAEMEIQ